ncbi:MAG: squalene/phytoene synthase family protein [Verrucomicrobia bacterium]|nr:squalene/phytoene synthase family protein [Verrucomicrobiota bacterium]
MSGEAELFALLKGVSRSFYISVRFLPKRIRLTIALGYLLARATDTVADTNRLPPAERIWVLQRLLGSVASGEMRDTGDLTACLTAQANGPEKVLLGNIQRVLQFLSAIPPEHRQLLNEVLTKIVRGQTLDIERFESRAGIHGLADDSALEEYTYLVAGSVGEFWTKVCCMEWPGYARLPEPELLVLGKDFGKGLQLINILRDYPVDLQAGRSYLPISNLEEVAANVTLARPEWERWRRRALSYLEAAWKYLTAVRPPRVRFACAVPLFIGIRTLLLLGEQPEIRPGIKVSRKVVQRLMAWAAGVALFRFLEPYASREIFRQ